MRFLYTILFSSAAMLCMAQTTVEDVSLLLSKHKYAKIYKCFDENMQDKVPKTKLQELWEGLETTAGKLRDVEKVQINSQDGGSRQSAFLRFDVATLKIVLSENEHGKISGLFISQLGYSSPPYAEGLATGKKYINFTSHSYELSGELVIPLDCKNCPVVVFVHGSGPNDRNETIGPNKVFYDLALGLASKGIASYRYDKRSNLYPETIKGQFDIYDETINDAIGAFHALKNDTSLHFGKYVMLGHSLGAYAMPLIVDSLGDELDGGVLLSANARRLEDLIEYQMDYLTAWDGEINKAEAKIIQENTAKAEAIRTNNYTLETSAEDLLAYWPGTFWKGIDDYNPVEMVVNNKESFFLILQGEKDYQITMTDYAIWDKNVGVQHNVTMVSYPELTHLFTPSKAEKSGPNDYFMPNNVDYQVILDLSDWIRLVIK